ncbi:MAG: hypothetical protein GEU75_06375 [Dehalococcoidia bacterium]|nr:hypothetical protein [Dehalococcoidia bacterium]
MKSGRPKHNDVLTPREWEVLHLAGEGLTNEQIGERLGISLNGAKYHMSEILAKLDVRTRADAVRFLENVDHRRGKMSLLLLPFWEKAKIGPSGLAHFALASASLVGVAMLILVVLSPGGRSTPTPTSDSYPEIGLDVGRDERANQEPAPALTNLENTLLLARHSPQNVGSESSTIESMRRVTTPAELDSALTTSTRVIVVDRSSLEDVRSSDILHRQLREGRAIIGLNITNAELREVSDHAGLVNAIRTNPAGPPLPGVRNPSIDGQPYYSTLQHREGYVIGGSQRYLFEGLFKAELESHDMDNYFEAPPTYFKIAELPEERISANQGMGCTYDEAKLASAAKRELVADVPHTEVPEIIISYCNPGSDNTVVLGALLPERPEAQVSPASPDCLGSGGGAPALGNYCPPTPAPRVQSAFRTVQIRIPIADLAR